MKNKNCISCWENMQEYTLLKTLQFDKDVMSFIFVLKIKVSSLLEHVGNPTLVQQPQSL